MHRDRRFFKQGYIDVVMHQMNAKRDEPQHLTGFASGPPPCY